MIRIGNITNNKFANFTLCNPLIITFNVNIFNELKTHKI